MYETVSPSVCTHTIVVAELLLYEKIIINTQCTDAVLSIVKTPVTLSCIKKCKLFL